MANEVKLCTMASLQTVSRPERAVIRAGSFEGRIGRVSLRGLDAATAALFAGVVLACAALVGQGYWIDEYADFSTFARSGWRFVMGRLLHWSPRPLAELGLFGYGSAVLATGDRLFAPCLGALWLGFLVLCLWTHIWRARGLSAEARRTDLLLSLALPACMLASGGCSEVFYWPAASFAYLPTLGGATLLLLQLAHGRQRTRAGRVACGVALLLMATSSEVGGLLAALFAAAMLPVALVRREPVLWLLGPGLLAAALLAMVVQGRLVSVEFQVGPDSAAGHALASLRLGSSDMLREVFAPATRTGVLGAVALHGLLVGGVALGVRPLRGESAWPVAVLMGGLLGTALVSVWVAYDHFGFNCCGRHATLRRAFVLLSDAGLGVVLAGWLGGVRVPGRVAASRFAFAGVAAIAAINRLPDAVHDVRLYAAAESADRRTRESGSAPAPDMMFILPPPRAIVDGPPMQAGIYDAHALGVPSWVLAFYGKERLDVVAEP